MQLNSPTIWRTILWTLYSIAIMLLVVLQIIGVKASQKIKIGPAVFIGSIAAAVYQVLFLVFNR